MSEKMVVGEEEEEKRGEERMQGKVFEEEEKGILGCWLQQGVVAMFTMDKQKQRAGCIAQGRCNIG